MQTLPLNTIATALSGAVSTAGSVSSAAAGTFAQTLTSVARSAGEAVETVADGSAAVGQSLLGKLGLVGETGAPIPVRIEELRYRAEEALRQFDQTLKRLLEDAGTDPFETLELTTDATGTLKVANEHPQRDEIERLLAGRTDLQQSFAGLSASYAILRAAERHEQFAARWDEDLQAAQIEYADLLRPGSPDEFHIRLSLFEPEVEFVPSLASESL